MQTPVVKPSSLYPMDKGWIWLWQGDVKSVCKADSSSPVIRSLLYHSYKLWTRFKFFSLLRVFSSIAFRVSTIVQMAFMPHETKCMLWLIASSSLHVSRDKTAVFSLCLARQHNIYPTINFILFSFRLTRQNKIYTTINFILPSSCPTRRINFIHQFNFILCRQRLQSLLFNFLKIMTLLVFKI